ncbi:hypothetical protein AB0G04_07045 [Actinoplanes sp. NPDC023801]|uniref:hypothetical protein n=1 Tax=Actinoplanes sp. NPDC023801 TaxID=3154595 RepID=UPI003407BC6E
MLNAEQAADYVSRYDGVDPGVLSDGSWLLDRPEFWAGLLDGSADTDLVEAVLDRCPEPLGLWDEVAASGRWPVLRLGAGDSDLAVVEWHGPDHEGGLDFVVLPHGTGRCLSVASVEGHGWGPGLSWPEALRLVDLGTLGTPAQRLLLLQPAIGDAGAPETAAALLADALIAVCAPGASPAVALETARQLLDRPARWFRQDGALICDAETSPRRGGGFPPDDLLLITRALGG